MLTFKVGELFCGPGGIAFGAHLASVNGVKVISAWANDYDKDTCETYRNNIKRFTPDVKTLNTDVRKLDINTLTEIDGFCFGFPCNDFSVVGQQKGMNGLYGPLYSYGTKVINKLKPKWFMAENVSGLRNANDGNAFDLILNDLKNEGYNLFPHLYKFEEYGVPQARHRLIIIGIRHDLNVEFKIPEPTHLKNFVTSKEAIETPAINKKACNHEFTNQSKTVIERLKYIKPGENAFTADIPKALQLNIKGAKISQIYKRLDPTKPSYTITGSGGGGTHVYHWKENRALTNRERARLQTFPDDFKFIGSKESVRKQIGMAVPPKGAKVIFEALFKSFKGLDYNHIPYKYSPLYYNKKNLETFYNNGQMQLLEPNKKYDTARA